MYELALMRVNGGDADRGDKAIAVIGIVGLVCVGVACVSIAPVAVAVAVGIMGSCLGVSSAIAGGIKTFFGK